MNQTLDQASEDVVEEVAVSSYFVRYLGNVAIKEAIHVEPTHAVDQADLDRFSSDWLQANQGAVRWLPTRLSIQ